MTELIEGWEIVIGLEVHTELLTQTKLFCGCRNAFGDEPNTNICPVCLGLPGSLPVLNAAAVELAAAVGTALGSEVKRSTFHRKNYFYPDMPKDYQVSQYDEPICSGGSLALADGKVVGIVRAHLEEDTGKTSHVGGDGRIHGSDYSLVDYNRAGVPLVEIVSEPDMRSADEARAYVSELRGILVAIGASDGRMEEGSLRVDANVSVRRQGEDALGTRCEIKNLNSLRSLGRAVDYEARRQVEQLSSGNKVAQETRHWNEGQGRTIAMRSKEEAFDYRYFPEPDLVPIVPGEALLERVRAQLGRVPAERRKELMALLEAELGESSGQALAAAVIDQVATLVDLGLDELMVAAVAQGAPARLALARAANEAAAQPEAASHLDAGAFARLLVMEAGGKLGSSQAKAVLSEMLRDGGEPEQIVVTLGLGGLDEDALAAAVDAVIAAHPTEWERFKAGDTKIAGFVVGQVMKATGGKADGKAVRAIMQARST